jgi:cysteinyl-tRNA synthetase
VRLFNTLTREIETVRPADGRRLGLYCCGPTVYGPAHIGNFRTFVLQDVLRRALEFHARRNGWSVLHVRNLTDVDDKTIRDSQAAGQSLEDFTGHWTRKFHEDCARLNLLPPHHEPSATGHIAEQVALIEALLRKGNAYVAADGSVYFRIASFAGYGRLSHLDRRTLSTGASGVASAIAADEYDKEGASDFALWKAWRAEDGPVKWPGPKGAADGRPGWHIECSAMSCKYLGPTFDLHSGGEDLIFPHHENEIAQSECGYGEGPFARHWFHCSHLLVDGRKMSKSLGNFHLLDDIVAHGHTPIAFRFALLSGYYRQKLNFTWNSVQAAESALASLAKLERTLLAAAGPEAASLPASTSDLGPFSSFWENLCDDLNTPAALGALFEARARIEASKPDAATARAILPCLFAVLDILGVPRSGPAVEESRPSAPPEVAALALQRWEAKQRKDFAAADRLRGEIAALGWRMLDSKTDYRLEPEVR